MDKERRAAIAQNILDMCAGADFETVIAAQCDALATGIIGTFHMFGKSQDEAERFMEEIVRAMVIHHVRVHWGTIEHTDAGPEGHS